MPEALLLVPSSEAALARVAGLPLVRRNALALRQAGYTVGIAAEDPRVLAAVSGLADEVGTGALDVPCDQLWLAGELVPCRTPDERRAAERRLFAALRKPVDGPVSRWLNRYLSLAVTRLLLDTKVTPNQMTLVATAIGVAGVAAVFSATWTGVAVGAVLVQIQSILDGCDGEIARLKFQASPFGAWLDNVLDDLVNAAFGLALGVASAELLGQPVWKWLGIFAAAAFSCYYALVYAQLALVHRTGNPFAFRWWFQSSSSSDPSEGGRVAGALRALARRDVFLLGFMILALVRLPQIAVAWYAVLGAAYLGLSAVHVVKVAT